MELAKPAHDDVACVVDRRADCLPRHQVQAGLSDLYGRPKLFRIVDFDVREPMVRPQVGVERYDVLGSDPLHCAVLLNLALGVVEDLVGKLFWFNVQQACHARLPTVSGIEVCLSVELHRQESAKALQMTWKELSATIISQTAIHGGLLES